MGFLALQVPEFWVHIVKKPGNVENVFLLVKTRLEDFMSPHNTIQYDRNHVQTT